MRAFLSASSAAISSSWKCPDMAGQSFRRHHFRDAASRAKLETEQQNTLQLPRKGLSFASEAVCSCLRITLVVCDTVFNNLGRITWLWHSKVSLKSLHCLSLNVAFELREGLVRFYECYYFSSVLKTMKIMSKYSRADCHIFVGGMNFVSSWKIFGAFGNIRSMRIKQCFMSCDRSAVLKQSNFSIVVYR